MHTGIERRTSRVFAADGRSVILAFDHGLWGARSGGMADPEKTLREGVAAGIDAVLTSVGSALHVGSAIDRVGLVLSLDRAQGDPRAAIDEALGLGADMVKAMCFPGSNDEAQSLSDTARIVAECHARQLPVLLEAVPVDFEATSQHTTENVAAAARIGAELGADVLKTHFTGDAFPDVLEGLAVPLVVLGGPTRVDDRGVLADVEAAMRAGAAGVAIGRNLWGHPTPARMIAAVGVLVHGGGTLDEALRELG